MNIYAYLCIFFENLFFDNCLLTTIIAPEICNRVILYETFKRTDGLF